MSAQTALPRTTLRETHSRQLTPCFIQFLQEAATDTAPGIVVRACGTAMDQHTIRGTRQTRRLQSTIAPTLCSDACRAASQRRSPAQQQVSRSPDLTRPAIICAETAELTQRKDAAPEPLTEATV